MSGHDAIIEDFFKVIDTPLKAYIIGLIAFNKKDKADEGDAMNVEIKLNNNIFISSKDSTLVKLSIYLSYIN